MGKYHGIHLGSLEHIDVLALLYLIGNIIDNLFLLFFTLGSIVRIAAVCTVPGCITVGNNFCFYLVAAFIGCIFCFIRVNLIDFQALRQRHIFAV